MFTLNRTGGTPVTFEGKLLARGQSYHPDEKLDRGYDLEVYLTQEGRWVARIGFQTRWKTEAATSRCLIAESAPELAAALSSYNPLQDVVGYPKGAQFDGKQKHLTVTLRLKWTSLLGSVLVQIPQMATQA